MATYLAMHLSERNRLQTLQRALLLAASDMQQAAEAARMLQAEADGTRARVLETAMAVCYMRPFTTSDLKLPDEYVPTAGVDEAAHEHLKTLRDKAYAHTDKSGGRGIRDFTIAIADEIVHFNWKEGWMPFPRANLPFVIGLCERQAKRMQLDAALIQRELERELKPENSAPS
jgi:hypothetical protein